MRGSINIRYRGLREAFAVPNSRRHGTASLRMSLVLKCGYRVLALVAMLAMLPKIQYRYTFLGIIITRVPGLQNPFWLNSLRAYRELTKILYHYRHSSTTPKCHFYTALSPTRHDGLEVAQAQVCCVL